MFKLIAKHSTAASCGVADADACRFIDSAGITDATQKSALNQLVASLKDSSLWTKAYAIWPMVGGLYEKCKWNLVNPVNSDAGYRLDGTFNTVTFASTGATTSTSYGNTHLVPSTVLSTSSLCLVYYSGTNVSGGYDMGSSNDAGAVTFPVALAINYGVNTAYALAGNGSYACSTTSSTDSRGMFTTNRLGTSTDIYKNGVSIKNITETVTSLTSQAIYIFGINAGGTSNYRNSRECRLSAVFQGLTSTEQRMLYNIIQAFQTTLGRQV